VHAEELDLTMQTLRNAGRELDEYVIVLGHDRLLHAYQAGHGYLTKEADGRNRVSG
jgi:hypothetical protein